MSTSLPFKPQETNHPTTNTILSKADTQPQLKQRKFRKCGVDQRHVKETLSEHVVVEGMCKSSTEEK
jgi:hypothetical protein